MTNSEIFKNNIRKYLDMYFKGQPLVDDFRNVFTFLRKISDYAPANFYHDYPFDITWEITSGCNLRCKHCYIQGRENPYITLNDLESEDAIFIAKNICNYFEACHVTLTGGEPFLHPKIFDIIKILKDSNISVYIQTNAVLLDKEKIKKLSTLLNPNIDIVQVSLDGLNESHDKIRDKKIYDKIIENIKELVNNNIFTSINCTLSSINCNEVLDLFLMCNDLGVKRFTLTKLIASVEEQKKYIISDEKIFEIIAQILDKKISLNLPIIINPICYKFVELVNNPIIREVLDEYKEFWQNNNKRDCLNCHNREKLSIKPDGKIYLCPEVISPNALIGDLKKQSIDEIWENIDSHPLYQKRLIKNMECKNCIYLLRCQAGCMGENFVKTDNINSRSPLCKLF